MAIPIKLDIKICASDVGFPGMKPSWLLDRILLLSIVICMSLLVSIDMKGSIKHGSKEMPYNLMV